MAAQSEQSALHELADDYDRRAITDAKLARDKAHADHVLDRIEGRALEDNARRCFQLARDLRTVATRIDVDKRFDLVDAAKSDAERALRHLMSWRLHLGSEGLQPLATVILRAGAGEDAAEQALLEFGGRLLPEEGVIAIAVPSLKPPRLFAGSIWARAFADSTWDPATWIYALEQLEGTTRRKIRVDGIPRNSILIPLELLGIEKRELAQ